MVDIQIIDSFITGSRAYGSPSEVSDCDLAVLCHETSQVLWQWGESGNKSCRFGKLNLITFTVKEQFEKWREVTKELIKLAPVTREFAVTAFKQAGFENYGEVNKG